MKRSFDEVHVYEGVGERTGIQLDRDGVRGRTTVCRSVGELAAKARRLGDGYYYLASTVWPSGSASVNLALTWVPIGGGEAERDGR